MAYRNSPALFRTVPSQPPTVSSSPTLGFATPTPPTSPEVIRANTLNFKPNFKFLRLNFFLGGGIWPSQFRCALARPSQSQSKSQSQLTCNSLKLVDQSSLDFFHQMQEELLKVVPLSDFGFVASLQRYSRSKSEVVQNCQKFCTLLAPNFFWGGEPPETCIIKFSQFPIMWQSFMVISPGTSENVWQNKKHHG